MIMRRLFSVLLPLLFLWGCGDSGDAMDRATAFRAELLNGGGCSFTAAITADYSDILHTFQLYCSCDQNGNISFEVKAPESISGITGRLSADGGHLTFDDHALLFPMLAEGRISPVSAPWVFLRALRSGYISGCGEKDGALTIYVDDTYEKDALQVVVCMNEASVPISAEVYYRENRIIAMVVDDFLIL